MVRRLTLQPSSTSAEGLLDSAPLCFVRIRPSRVHSARAAHPFLGFFLQLHLCSAMSTCTPVPDAAPSQCNIPCTPYHAWSPLILVAHGFCRNRNPTAEGLNRCTCTVREVPPVPTVYLHHNTLQQVHGCVWVRERGGVRARPGGGGAAAGHPAGGHHGRQLQHRPHAVRGPGASAHRGLPCLPQTCHPLPTKDPSIERTNASSATPPNPSYGHGAPPHKAPRLSLPPTPQSCSTTFIRRSTGIPSMYQDTDGSSTALGPGPLRSGTSALCGRLPADWEALSQAHGLRHFVAVPLSCGHSLVGVLTLASKLGATLSEAHRVTGRSKALHDCSHTRLGPMHAWCTRRAALCRSTGCNSVSLKHSLANCLPPVCR